MRGRIAIIFKSYLIRLKEIEESKQKSEQRKVPTAAEVARRAGLAPNTGSRLIHGHVTQVSLAKVAAILDVMNEAGFEADLNDFLIYIRED